MKTFKHLPTKKVQVITKTGKIYDSTRHYNPDKENKQDNKKPSKIDKFNNYLNDIGEKSKEFAQFAKDYISPDEFIQKLRTGDLDKNDPVIKRMLEHITGIAYLDSFKEQKPIFQFDGHSASFNNDYLISIRKLTPSSDKTYLSVKNDLLEKDLDNNEKDIAEKVLITQVNFLEEYFGKGNYKILTNALTSPDIYEPYIGAGIWFYKGMDIINFPGLSELVESIKKIKNSNGSLTFIMNKNGRDNLEKFMLGKFKYNNTLNPIRERRIKYVFSELFGVKKYNMDTIIQKLTSEEGLTMRDLLKYMPAGYDAIITDKDTFIENYMKRNS